MNSWAVTQMTDQVTYPAGTFDVPPDIYVRIPELHEGNGSTLIGCYDISHAIHITRWHCTHGTPCEHQIIGKFWTDEPAGSAVEVVLATYDKGVSPKFYELPT